MQYKARNRALKTALQINRWVDKGEGAPHSDKVIFQNALNELRIGSKGFSKPRQAPINPELDFESTIFSNDFQPSIFRF